MEDFDLPPERVPLELLGSVLARLDREIVEKLPFDFLSPLRRSPLFGMDHGQSECRIFLLLADRRQNSKLTEANFKKRFIRIAFVILDSHPVQTFDRDFVHFVGNCIIAVPGVSINAGSHQYSADSSFRRGHIV